MTALAVVVLAHSDPHQVRRLIDALEDVPIVLHCDAKTPRESFTEMVAGLPRRVVLADRVSATLASWSLVEAELVALRAALVRSDAGHIAVLSGADYPLVTMAELTAHLADWEGRSWFYNRTIPHEPWSTPRHPDGGQWRFRYRYLTWHGHVRYVAGHPVRWPIPRSVPAGLQLRAASQWKIYARQHVQALLHVADDEPDLMRFWRSTLVPDESFAASVLASPRFSHNEPLLPCAFHPWFTSWDATKSDHPDWLDLTHLPALEGDRARPYLTYRESLTANDSQPYRRLFARKFSTDRSSDVLDALDLLRVSGSRRD